MSKKEFKVKIVGNFDINQLNKNFYDTLFEYLMELHKQKESIA